VRRSFAFAGAFCLLSSLLACPGPSAYAEDAPDPEQIQQGKRLFISHGCGWCHEAGGRRAGRCPQLMDDPHDNEFFINRIVGGSQGRMPAFGTILGASEITAIITYLRNLKPES
jgi:mono/diheme cytochrome c family protein